MAATMPRPHQPGCEYPQDHLPRHPCGIPYIPGLPCDYCGELTPLDGRSCPTCWQQITIADFKGLCAAEGLDTAVTLAGQQ